MNILLSNVLNCIILHKNKLYKKDVLEVKLLTLELTTQTYEKLIRCHEKYMEDRKNTAEVYANNGNFDMAKKLSQNFSVEEMVSLILTKYLDEKYKQ